MKSAYRTGERVKGILLVEFLKAGKHRKDGNLWLCQNPDGELVYYLERSLRRRKNDARSRTDSLVGRVFSDYTYRCRKRGINWALTPEDVRLLILAPCHYCALPPSNTQRGFAAYSGIDRKNNHRGYTRDNTVPCCSDCNAVKSSILSYEEMKVAIAAILKLRAEVQAAQTQAPKPTPIESPQEPKSLEP